jgi:hypothetical protein
MNEAACFGDEYRRSQAGFRAVQTANGFSTALMGFAMSGITGFLIAVSGVSAVIYWLMTRVENRAAARRSDYDRSGSDSSYAGSAGASGWSLTDWFGGSSFSSHGSGSSSDYSGGSDSGGGGGDGGGGGGGD